MKPSATKISDLTAAVLNSSDSDEVLELLIETIWAEIMADLVFVLLPLDESTWVCELAKGRFSNSLLGTKLSRLPGYASVDSRLAYALAQDEPASMKPINWQDISRGLTGSFLLPAKKAESKSSLDQVISADLALSAEYLDQLTGHQVVSFKIDAGANLRGLLCAVKFHAAAQPELSFTKTEKMALAAYASLFSFTLNGSSGRSLIEDDLRDERNRIARDLHDLAIQELFGVGMQLEALSKALEKPDNEQLTPRHLHQQLRASLNGVERSIAEIRAIVQSLRNESVDLTLTQRLRHECAIATAGLGFAPSLQFHSPADVIDEITGELAEDIVAVVKECLANAARHAHASAVAVTVATFAEGVEQIVQVNISDNGRGIDPNITRRSGLANLASRARRHDGWVDFYALDPGTMVSWRATVYLP